MRYEQTIFSNNQIFLVLTTEYRKMKILDFQRQKIVFTIQIKMDFLKMRYPAPSDSAGKKFRISIWKY